MCLFVFSLDVEKGKTDLKCSHVLLFSTLCLNDPNLGPYGGTAGLLTTSLTASLGSGKTGKEHVDCLVEMEGEDAERIVSSSCCSELPY